jgi:tetratricopeptide (TPR) repeat protein
MLLLPLVFFVLLEGILRFIDYGGDLSLFRETVVNGKAYYTINPDVTKRYFRTIQVRAIVSNEMFEKEKGPNTYRIFCLGESSTLGYPFMFNGSFPSMLKGRLERMWPDKNIEVVNLGITAVNSYTVADFTKELVAYKPDALLIYCGHNEFYGALGVGSTEGLGKSRWVVKTYLAMESWRTFRLFRDGVNALKQKLGPDRAPGREATVMEGMVRNREIVYGSNDYVAARNNFRGNLEDIAQIGASNNIRVAFGTLVSNLSGVAPFVSTFSPGLETSRRDEWARHYKEAEDCFEKKDFGAAEEQLLSALKIDSLPAKAHFLLAKVYENSGRFEPASREYRLARDFDGLRFRAPSEFNDILRDVSTHYGLPVAESEKLIAENSEHGIIGDRYAVEHVHLNVDGYFLLSKAFYQVIADNGFIAPKEKWNWKLERSDDQYRAEVCVTPLDSVMASIRLFVLKNSWPFREGGISVQQFDARTDLERLAKSCLMRELTWEQGHVKAAERYESEGKLMQAAGEYRALAKVTPFNRSPLLRLGQLLLNAGDDDAASLAFGKSLKIAGSYYAHQGIGFVCLRKKEFEQAAGEFRKALQFTNGIAPAAIVETQQLLAVALASGGKFAEAETVAQSIVSAHPEQSQARDLLDHIRREMSTSGGKRQ